MRRMNRPSLPALLLLVVLGFAPHVEAEPSFRPLGDLPGGEFESFADGISADGTTVVGLSRSASGDRAFRWTESEGMVALEYPDPDASPLHSRALDVSADGSVVVGSYGWDSGFRWTPTEGMTLLPVGQASGVSDDGSVIVGGYSDPDVSQAYRWTEGTGAVPLGYLDASDPMSSAWNVSANGSVVVGYSRRGTAVEAFRWTEAEGMIGLGDIGNSESYATAVSADGAVIIGTDGSYSADSYKAFRWTEAGGMVDLGYLPGGRDAIAKGISADGSVIVGSGTSQYGAPWEAFIWDELNGMRSLQNLLTTQYDMDLTGWLLLDATSISADGLTIAGYGSGPNGREAWVVTLSSTETVPVPAAAFLSVLGLSFAGWRLRRGEQ